MCRKRLCHTQSFEQQYTRPYNLGSFFLTPKKSPLRSTEIWKPSYIFSLMLRLFFAVCPSPCTINIPKQSNNLVRIHLLPFSLARTQPSRSGRALQQTRCLPTRRSCPQTAPGKQERAPCEAGDCTSGFLFCAVPSDTSLTQFTAYKPSNPTVSRREQRG